MINPYKTVDWDPTPGKIRKTLFFIVVFALILLGVLWIRLKITPLSLIQKYPLTFSVIVILFLTGIILPVIGKWLYRIWFGAACAAGFCISNLILLICFYIIMTPLALIRRLFGVQPLPLKHQPHSNWTDHEVQNDPAGYFRQF